MPSRLRQSLDIIPSILLDIINFRSSQNNLFGFQPLRLFNKFPCQENNWENADHGVGEDESRDIPIS